MTRDTKRSKTTHVWYSNQLEQLADRLIESLGITKDSRASHLLSYSLGSLHFVKRGLRRPRKVTAGNSKPSDRQNQCGSSHNANGSLIGRLHADGD